MRNRFNLSTAICALFSLGAAPLGCDTSAGGDGGSSDAGRVVDAGSGTDDAGTGDEDAGAGPCGRFAHPRGDGECETSLSWREGPRLPGARDHHATFVHAFADGLHLVTGGGARDSFSSLYDDLHRARIGDDGSLGQWQAMGSVWGALPSTVSGHTFETANGYVYLFGGRDSFASEDWVYSAPLGDDGTVGVWTELAPLPVGTWHHQSFVRDGFVYVVGGQVTNSGSDAVHRARLLPEGGLEAWEALTPLPNGLSHHGVAVSERSIYAVGGLDDAQGEWFATVLRADFDDEGRLSEWTPLSPFPHPIVTPSVAYFDGAVYVVGGLIPEPGNFVGDAWRAPVLEDGELGEWTSFDAPVPTGRAHVHQLPVVDGYIYSLGGRTNPSPTASVIPSTAAVYVGKLE